MGTALLNWRRSEIQARLATTHSMYATRCRRTWSGGHRRARRARRQVAYRPLIPMAASGENRVSGTMCVLPPRRTGVVERGMFPAEGMGLGLDMPTLDHGAKAVKSGGVYCLRRDFRLPLRPDQLPAQPGEPLAADPNHLAAHPHF